MGQTFSGLGEQEENRENSNDNRSDNENNERENDSSIGPVRRDVNYRSTLNSHPYLANPFPRNQAVRPIMEGMVNRERELANRNVFSNRNQIGNSDSPRSTSFLQQNSPSIFSRGVGTNRNNNNNSRSSFFAPIQRQGVSRPSNMRFREVHNGSQAPSSNIPSSNVLTRILSAAANAISLTAQEHRESMDQAARSTEQSQTSRTAATFMDSFLNHLQMQSDNAPEPFPRLSLISEASDNSDGSTAVFRVFRMSTELQHNTDIDNSANQGGDGLSPLDPNISNNTDSTATTNSATSTQPTEPTEPTPFNLNTDRNAPTMVPVLIIGIRSVANDTERAATQTSLDSQNENSNLGPSTRSQTRSENQNISSPLNSISNNTETPPLETDSRGDNETRPSARRSWIIYVVGSNYPQNHPIFTGALSDNPTYEELLHLSSLLGPARPPTTTMPEIVAQTTEIIFEESSLFKSGISFLNGNMCQVCLLEYENKDKLRLLKCQHAFHIDCIDKWLTTGANNCPVCRRPATVKDFKPEKKKENNGDGASYVSLVHDRQPTN